ncbi:MAG: VWA domain-containing protein [Alphaproteobacteria bacterium]|jgi:hypothetical protein|nr:VWA domain-containing protein [Alphaproteobacteria bacterium]MDP6567977.1 VWA domain-containing protein [Alphaproteobacteria bacterium]MDP6815442.1 VWA domain-containing protein [Alphaproteobacteria bacterium]
MSNLKRLMAGAALVGGLALGAAQTQAAIIADIVWVIDDSVSMGGDINEVKTRIADFDAAMIANSIDANYALIRFGGPNNIPAGCINSTGNACMTQDLTDFTTFNSGWFSTMGAPTSAEESGSEGTVHALNNVSFRANSVKNIIVVTDEDDDSDGFNNTTGPYPYATVTTHNLLTAHDALFNFIGRPGVGNTDDTYGFLAANHGGAAFNILDFRADPEPFFDNFINTKVEEIKEHAAPEPAALGLFGLALLGLGAARRRRAKVA